MRFIISFIFFGIPFLFSSEVVDSYYADLVADKTVNVIVVPINVSEIKESGLNTTYVLSISLEGKTFTAVRLYADGSSIPISDVDLSPIEKVYVVKNLYDILGTIGSSHGTSTKTRYNEILKLVAEGKYLEATKKSEEFRIFIRNFR